MKSLKQRKPLFERLKTGLEEATSHARGEITLKTTTLNLPEVPPEDDRAPARTARSPDPTERSVSLPLKPMIPTGRSRRINLESWNGDGRAKVMLAQRALAMATLRILEISDIALIADRQACNELHWTSLGGWEE